MINALLLLGLITIAAGVIVLLDWLGRKRIAKHVARSREDGLSL